MTILSMNIFRATVQYETESGKLLIGSFSYVLYDTSVR